MSKVLRSVIINLVVSMIALFIITKQKQGGGDIFFILFSVIQAVFNVIVIAFSKYKWHKVLGLVISVILVFIAFKVIDNSKSNTPVTVTPDD
jgi:Na+-transporting NADH:ubiquinone oxidoreductase subunit NqrB